MLVLSREKGQSVCIDGKRIIVTLIDIKGNKARLGFEADDSVTIHRKEVQDRIGAEVKSTTTES